MDIFPELNKKSKLNLRIVSISGNGKVLYLRSGSSFYAINKKIQKTKNAPAFYQGDFLLPPDFVEAIFINLVNYEILYDWKETELILKIPNRANQPSFLPVQAIIIDPGHGGKDPGTSDKKGNNEKDIALKISLILESQLRKKFPNLLVYLTRKEDIYVSLEERAAFANRILQKTKDAIFISIHCNSAVSLEPYGFEVYFLSQTPTLEQEREVAIRENKIIDSPYPEPIPSIQIGLMSSLIQRRSKNLALSVDKELGKGIGKLIPSRGVKKANFSVLRGSLMPAILIEVGYLSNPREAVFLNTSKVQTRIAQSIMKGIQNYSNGKD